MLISKIFLFIKCVMGALEIAPETPALPAGKSAIEAAGLVRLVNANLDERNRLDVSLTGNMTRKRSRASSG